MKKSNEIMNGYQVTLRGWPSVIRRKRAVMKTFTELKERFPGASFHAVAKAAAVKHEISVVSVSRIAKEAGFETWKTL